ncbi:MAG: ankyrin repeat domain-containing protein [Abditibacteriaceae bacterium]
MKTRIANWLFLTVIMLFCATISFANKKPDQKSLNVALLKSVEDGKTEEVRSLLQQGASINAENEAGDKPIIIAAYVDESAYQYGPSHSLALFKLLLSYRPNINVKNQMGVTALITAASTGSFEAVKLLVQKGAQINDKDNENETALMGASYSQGEGEAYASPEIVKYLLSHSADVNMKSKDGHTALIYVTKLSQYRKKDAMAIVRMLLAKGADVNVRTKNGNTALKWAKANGLTAIVRVLVRAGATD